MKNIGQSKLAKLKNHAKNNKLSIMPLLDQYAYLGFLRRLSKHSEWRKNFSLKGGLMVFALTGDTLRPTRDIDLDGVEDLTADELSQIMLDILKIETNDGLEFDFNTFSVVKDATHNSISGVKVRINAHLGSAKIPVHIDIGMQNVITPHVNEITLPKLLVEDEDITIYVYPIETSIAEKFRAMCTFGADNTRLKDYYDIYKYSKLMPLNSDTMAEAIVKSFNRLDVEVPRDINIPSFDPNNFNIFIPQWQAFLRKNNIPSEDFEVCVQDIKKFLAPVIDNINSNGLNCDWDPINQVWIKTEPIYNLT